MAITLNMPTGCVFSTVNELLFYVSGLLTSEFIRAMQPTVDESLYPVTFALENKDLVATVRGVRYFVRSGDYPLGVCLVNEHHTLTYNGQVYENDPTVVVPSTTPKENHKNLFPQLAS